MPVGLRACLGATLIPEISEVRVGGALSADELEATNTGVPDIPSGTSDLLVVGAGLDTLDPTEATGFGSSTGQKLHLSARASQYRSNIRRRKPVASKLDKH